MDHCCFWPSIFNDQMMATNIHIEGIQCPKSLYWNQSGKITYLMNSSTGFTCKPAFHVRHTAVNDPLHNLHIHLLLQYKPLPSNSVTSTRPEFLHNKSHIALIIPVLMVSSTKQTASTFSTWEVQNSFDSL